MSEYYTVKLHNSQRIKKIQTEGMQKNRRNRPHAYYKNFTYLQIPRMMAKYGYDYETQNQVMQEVQESFKAKCEAYYNKTRINKLGRMDKIRRKEEFDFKLKQNPLARMINLLQQKVVNPIFAESIQNLEDYQSTIRKNTYMMHLCYQY